MLRDPRVMSKILRRARSLEEAAQALVDAAVRAGGEDDIAVGLMRIVPERGLPV
jgi:serine/threonine protein phosphatase PrpC